MATKSHFVYLDVLRGISALFIMLYHYTTRYIENPLTTNEYKVDWPITFNWGCAAVSTFFILSGFLTSKYLFTKNDSGGVGARGVWLFLRNRLLRLYPAFIVSMFTTTIVLALFFDSVDISAKQVLLNITMIPTILGQRPIDGVYWTLQIEIMFYLGVAVLMLCRNVNVVKCLLLLWVMTPILYWFGNSILNSIINVVFISDYVSTFLAGIALYLWVYHNDKMYSILLLLMCFVSQLLMSDIVHIIFFILTIIAIFLVVKNDHCAKSLIARVFKWVGDISYPLYLVHQMIGFTILYNIQCYYGITSEAIIIIPIVVSIMYSHLLHKYIELPFAQLVKRGC